MDFTPWIQELTKEGAVIRDAPFVFGISLVLASLAIWYGVHYYYRENLKIKEDLLSSLRGKIKIIEEKATSPIASLPRHEKILTSDIVEVAPP